MIIGVGNGQFCADAWDGDRSSPGQSETSTWHTRSLRARLIITTIVLGRAFRGYSIRRGLEMIFILKKVVVFRAFCVHR